MLPKIRTIVNKALLRIFMALLLVAVTMFIANYMVYRNSITGIYQQVSENNKLVVKNMIRLFDDSFKNINDILYSIQMLSYNAWKSDGRVDLNQAYSSYLNVRSLVSSIDYIEEVVIFHQGSDLAITTQGTISLKELLQRQYANPNYNAEFWLSLTNTKHPLRVFSTDAYTNVNTGVGRKLIPVLGSTQISDLNVLVFLKIDKLLEHVNEDAMMQGTSLIVMDENRNVILNTDPNWSLFDTLRELNLGTQAETTLKNKDYVYQIFQSDYNGFVYIHKAPYLFANMKDVRDANVQIMLVAIAFALLLSAALSLYLYRPVRHIVKLITGRELRGADYGNIRTGIVRMQEENESIKHQMGMVRTELRKAAFLEALHGLSGGRELEQRLQRDYPAFYEHRFFVLAALRLPPRPADADTRADTHAGASEDVPFLEAELSRQFDAYGLFPLEPGFMVAVIGIPRLSERDSVLRQLHVVLRHAMSGIWQGLAAEAAVSRVFTSEAAHVAKAFQDVTDGFAYRHLDSTEAVIDYQTIQATWKVYAPLDEIGKASQCLVVGNVDACVQIIETIVRRNEELHVHRRQLVAVAGTIFYELLKQADANGKEAKRFVALEKAFFRQLEPPAGAPEIREALVGTARAIAETTAKSEAKRKLDPASISQYIEAHYMENLHLDHMAERLQTTPKYFSSFFKRTFSVNFVEYLNKVRLHHAKRMLQNPDLSISEISEKTGYLNASTFTSTFKKHFGISPSEYRKQLNR